MQSADSINMKNKISVLPSYHFIILACFAFSGHIVHNIPKAYDVKGEVSSGIDMICVSKFGSAFPFCLPEVIDDSNGAAKVDPAAVLAGLGLSCVALHLKMQSLSPIGKKDQNSVLPNTYSRVLICVVFLAHAAHNLRNTYGVQGTVGQSLMNNTGSASISKLFPAVVLGFLALSLIGMAVQNLMQSFNSIDNKKGQNSILPKFRSLALVCAVFCIHVVRNAGILSTASLPVLSEERMIQIFAMLIIATSMAVALAVQVVVQKSSSVGQNKAKRSVLPNSYSVVLITGIFCTHLVHHFANVSGIGETLPKIGLLLFSLVVMGLRMRSKGLRLRPSKHVTATKSNKPSVLPNMLSITLIICVLCAHFTYNCLSTTTSSSDEKVGSILGASSAIQRFGHKELGAAENIPAEVLENSPKNDVGAASVSSDVYHAQHSEGVPKASPKAIFASVLFAFIGITLKMGENSNDKKVKKSVLPNSRSMLFICCILFGHVVHNWPSTYIENSSEVSLYTGVEEVASWDESGSVLPDSAEDLDHLLEADMLTSR